MIRQTSGFTLESSIAASTFFSHSDSLEQPESQNTLLEIPYYQVPDLEAIPIDLTQPLILLAEDDESNILTIAGYLMMYGYRLLVARDGLEAIQLAQAYRPNLILMDLQMPNLDGIAAIERLRSCPFLSHVPIVAFTAMVFTNYHDRSLAAGANLYLIKPLRLKYLVASISQLLSKT